MVGVDGEESELGGRRGAVDDVERDEGAGLQGGSRGEEGGD